MQSDLIWNGLWRGVVGTFAMNILIMIGTLTGMSPMPKPIPLAILNKVLGEERFLQNKISTNLNPEIRALSVCRPHGSLL